MAEKRTSGEEFWEFVDETRGAARLDLAQVWNEAKKRGIVPDLDFFLSFTTRFPCEGDWNYPKALLTFVADFAEALAPRSALDPWARYGELLVSVNNRVQLDRGVGICNRDDERDVAQQIAQGSRIRWLAGDPIKEVGKLTETFDFVTSCAPWGYGRHTKHTLADGTTVEDDVGARVNYLALERLSSSGKALLIVNSGFVTSAKSTGWFSQRDRLGVNVEALIHFPSRFFEQAGADGYLCILSRESNDARLFVGEISKSTEHNKLLLENLLLRRSAADTAAGHMFSGEFRGFPQLVSSERSAAAARTMGLQPALLREIALHINLTQSSDLADFPQRDNAIFLPLIGRSKASDSVADLSMKAHNYAQIALDPSQASAAYLATYFNSPLGHQCRESVESGSAIPKITKGGLERAIVYVPDLNTQLQCVAVESKALNLRSEIDDILLDLRRKPRRHREAVQALRAVNRDDSFDGWLASLPFPLASVLAVYHTSGEDDKARYDALVYFFEALAGFVAVVLLSVMNGSPALVNHKEYPLNSKRPLGYSVRKSSFGSWIEIAARLAKFVRQLINDREMRPLVAAAFGNPLDLSQLEMLYDSALITALSSANEIRNRKAHGGIFGVPDAQARQTELESLLASVRSLMSSNWVDIPLYRAGSMIWESNMFQYDAERLMDRAAPFVRAKVQLSTVTKHRSLFLLPAGSTTPVVLLPLVRIDSSPTSAQNACYFYNSQSGDKLRYVSYHFDQAAELLLSDEGSVVAVENLISTTS